MQTSPIAKVWLLLSAQAIKVSSFCTCDFICTMYLRIALQQEFSVSHGYNRLLEISSAWDLLQPLAFPIWRGFIHKTSSLPSKPLAQCPCFYKCNPPLVLLDSPENREP